MSPPLISICIPAFRAVAFLGETLASVQAQTFSAWELVVVEDGSDDGTRALVEAFAATVAQPVRYLRHDVNRGLTATRNTGIRATHAAWIALLDADDLWLPGHLASLWETAAADATEVVHAGSILFDHKTGRELSIRAPDAATLASFPVSLFRADYIIQPSSVLLAKSVWERLGGFDESFLHAEDREMWLRCARAGVRFAFTGKNTCRYRKHGSALSAESAPMALAAARIFDQHRDWHVIPTELRTESAASAWQSAGRLLWRANPGQAADCFDRAGGIRFQVRWWLWSRAQRARHWWKNRGASGTFPVAAVSDRTQRGILTCILTKNVPEALALARSAALHAPTLGRAVVVEGSLTPAQESALRECYDHVLTLRPEDSRLGWQVKNVMFPYTPFAQTLFLDADCLVLRDLAPFFARMQGRDVCLAVKAASAQETGRALFANVSLAGLLRHFQVEWWPQLPGGGHFYFERTEQARQIFERARAWADLDRLREFGWTAPNISDELTLQLALVDLRLEQKSTLRDFPLVLWSPAISGNPDVFHGTVRGRGADGAAFFTREYGVIHFGGDHQNVLYRRERFRLGLHQRAMRLHGSAFASGIRCVNRRALIGAVAFLTLKADRLRGRLERLVRGRSPAAAPPAVASARL